MAVVTIPFTFVSQTVIASAQMNQNFSAVVAGFTNIDTSNIGPVGISAAKVTPGAFGIGAYIFQGNALTDVPVTIHELVGQTSPAFEITSAAGTALRFWVDCPQGNVNSTGALFLYPNNPTIGTYLATFQVGGTGAPGLGAYSFLGANPASATPPQLYVMDINGNSVQKGALFGVTGPGNLAGPALIVGDKLGTVTATTQVHAIYGSASITTNGSGVGSIVVALSGAQAFAGTNYFVAPFFQNSGANTGALTSTLTDAQHFTISLVGGLATTVVVVGFIAIGI